MAKTSAQYMARTINELNELIDYLTTLSVPGTLFFFEGKPGAGKTYLISKILERFEFNQSSSPTFAIHHTYVTEKLVFEHFDFYRLALLSELETVGFWDVFSKDKVFFIEWGSHFDDQIWPLDYRKIKIEIEKNEANLQSRNYLLTHLD